MVTQVITVPVATESKRSLISGVTIPNLIANSGEQACHKFVEYFIGQIRNPNTREAYGRAVQQFLSWCEQQGVQRLEDVTYLYVSAYVEQHPSSPQTVLQHLAAIRQLFAWLVQQRVLDQNPAEHVKGPKYRAKVGKTPVLDADDMRQLLVSFDCSHLTGLRDRALIALMTFTFARIGAVLAMNVEDCFLKGARRWIRLQEKGGKYLEMPLHHTADDYLHAYIAAADQQSDLTWGKGTAVFRSQQRGRVGVLSDRRLHRREALAMVKRRAQDAGIATEICNHTFRGTGITNYLERGGSRDIAQELAGHEDVRTTALYDRRASKVSLDEIERIRF
ncbi:tyrosine-type recombinase/integrase [Adonisia turfae]|uniref:Integrase n=1 Tax=Adonisia turfae CCMR0081 TaxID=2292702 RepID=A0A6M0RXZ2_9CYAN|nr:tyrosine-type recombinase/integrase [Adonisia turfae]NEZ61059.1 integrase [Adonisia turfae CCMR0081]